METPDIPMAEMGSTTPVAEMTGVVIILSSF
jgi:hypothetical protein